MPDDSCLERRVASTGLHVAARTLGPTRPPERLANSRDRLIDPVAARVDDAVAE